MTENIMCAMDTKISTVLEAIHDQTVQLQAMSQRIGDAEERIAAVETLTSSVDVKTAALEKQVRDLEDHVNDLENRGRRCNVRVVGLPEGTEGSDPVQFFEKWIPDHLQITTKAGRIKMDRAHRSLAPKPGLNQRPRSVILKFHNFTDKQRVMEAARRVGGDKSPRVLFFNGFSAALVKKRKAFDQVKARLKEKKIDYALLYPAILRVMVDGKPKKLSSPEEASAFVDTLE